MSVVTPEQQLQGLIEYIAGELRRFAGRFRSHLRAAWRIGACDAESEEEAMGRVIGRQGRIAKAMRTLVMITGSRNNVRAA